MSVIDVETTLGELVTAHPRLAGEFERRGLDYCCDGRRSLAEACRSVGLDPGTVAADLAGASDTSDVEPWATMSIDELVDHVEDVHHRYLWDELPRLTTLLDKVVGVHGGRHPELAVVAEVLAELRADLEPHLTKEELVLFPMMRELARAETRPTFHCGRVANPVSMMLLEHDRAGELLTRLGAATHDYHVPADGCASYRTCFEGLAELEADTHLHVHKENNLLFPAVVQLEEQLPTATGDPRRDDDPSAGCSASKGPKVPTKGSVRHSPEHGGSAHDRVVER